MQHEKYGLFACQDLGEKAVESEENCDWMSIFSTNKTIASSVRGAT